MARKGQAKYSADYIAKKTAEYLNACEASKKEYPLRSGDVKVRQDKYPTWVGLSLYLDIPKSTLNNYLEGNYPGKEEDTAKVLNTLVRAKAEMEEVLLQRAMSGDVDSKAAAILMGTFGYREKVEQEHTGGMTVAWEGLKPKEAEDFSV